MWTICEEREFPGTPLATRAARTFVRGIVTDARLQDAAVLAVGALVDNAVRNSKSGRPGGTFRVYIELWWDWENIPWVYLAVTDEGALTVPSSYRSAPSDTLGGRCLTAVTAVATEWGVISRQRSHMVWAWLDSVFAWQQVAALS
jgi:hypothetical protein